MPSCTCKKKQVTFYSPECRVTESAWTFILWAVFLQLLFAERARPVLASICFTFMQFQIFMPESLVAPPRTPVLATQQLRRNITHSLSTLCCITASLGPTPIPPFQKSSCSHSERRRRSYITRWQGLIGPNARGGSAESRSITTAVPLIGKVSPIRGHD